MKPANQSGDLFKGALILAAAALITKVLSAVYRVPFQNIVGDVGFYIYQQVYPFYGIAIVLSTYGFPVVISKLYAEQAKSRKEALQLLAASGLFLLAIGLAAFLIMFAGADWIASQMGDPKLGILLRTLSPAFLLLPATALLRGYFQGRGDMLPTAVSQVGEQSIRVATILAAAFILMKEGASLYTAGSGAIFGSVTGGIASAAILSCFFWRVIKKEAAGAAGIGLSGKAVLKTMKTIALQGAAISAASMLLILLQLADSLNLYSLLVSGGLEAEEAKRLKGIYDRGQPLIQLGTVIATSMSLSLVPLITAEKLKNNQKFLAEKAGLALRVSLLFGTGAAFGLWAIIKPVNIMLFENAEGSEVLSVLSLFIFFASIIMTLAAILQGLGHTFFPAVIIIGGFGIKYILNMLLVPAAGTMGAAIAACAALAVVLLALLARIRFLLRQPLVPGRFILGLGTAAAVMLLYLKAYLLAAGSLAGEGRLAAGLIALSAAATGGIVFMLLALKGETFRKEEISMLPFGSKLGYLLPGRNRR
ncbi:putative polysaccharide biosynthesis protein [Bacillus infantis]|uniref:putative polysaccharide biosynthesis protein n=1 Tax=Bacillus infantis TaxID=324767 RepID=UPI003CF746E2